MSQVVWRLTAFHAFHVWSRFSLPQGLGWTNSSCLLRRAVAVALPRYRPLASQRGRAVVTGAAVGWGPVSLRRHVPEAQSQSPSQQIDVQIQLELYVSA